MLAADTKFEGVWSGDGWVFDLTLTVEMIVGDNVQGHSDWVLRGVPDKYKESFSSKMGSSALEHWKGKRNGRALTAEGHATEDRGDIITKAKYELELQAEIDDHAADKQGAKKLQILSGGCSEHGKPKQHVRLVRYAEEDSGWVMVEQEDAPPADDDGAQPSMVRNSVWLASSGNA